MSPLTLAGPAKHGKMNFPYQCHGNNGNKFTWTSIRDQLKSPHRKTDTKSKRIGTVLPPLSTNSMQTFQMYAGDANKTNELELPQHPSLLGWSSPNYKDSNHLHTRLLSSTISPIYHHPNEHKLLQILNHAYGKCSKTMHPSTLGNQMHPINQRMAE